MLPTNNIKMTIAHTRMLLNRAEELPDTSEEKFRLLLTARRNLEAAHEACGICGYCGEPMTNQAMCKENNWSGFHVRAEWPKPSEPAQTRESR